MTAYLSIISGAIKLFNYIAGALQQHHDELNGSRAQQLTDLQAEVKADQNALKAANNSTPDGTTDSLRNGKF